MMRQAVEKSSRENLKKRYAQIFKRVRSSPHEMRGGRPDFIRATL